MSPLPFAAIAAIRSVSNVFLLTITNISDSLCFVESSPDPLTKEATFFLQPASAPQRQYEALRACFLVLCHHFRRSKPNFFRDLKPGPRTQPKKSAVRELVLAMRKKNLSVYDIEQGLQDQGSSLSVTAIWEIL